MSPLYSISSQHLATSTPPHSFNNHSHRSSMPSLLHVAVAVVLTPDVHAFSVTNCVTGAYHNYREAGNNNCQNFNTGNSVAYDSNKGLKLTVYRATNCQSTSFTTTKQNSCQGFGFSGQSVRAN
ncbi:hypothetical protein P153DRAFT_389312 [Dothidotthia symphoricarpi CBS 119687]|uniref:Uncharacterized protein n=1 Tax=Dothidotthia symphoricarpi CBS 119687 TaxID=1392245 RepID=A0A6A6A228_9PLEO|nr:uncharacterized protein P153DRAFT_389312 [Dothidotthia symphoricarpi CBS 119687]KAF2125860.1 hypothetical protein P153DRAFT_389312 [Dothidotthia symphoricarpi CBS 119687]